VKTIKFLVFLLLLLIISGCTRFRQLQEQPTDLRVGQSVNRIPADTFMGPPFPQQATLRLEVETSTATSGRFKLYNHSDQRVIYDNYFAVDVFEGDEWRELLFKEDVVFSRHRSLCLCPQSNNFTNQLVGVFWHLVERNLSLDQRSDH